MLGVENGQDLEEEWQVWRLVLSKTATLEEIETHWSLDDLIRANYALTYHQQSEVS